MSALRSPVLTAVTVALLGALLVALLVQRTLDDGTGAAAPGPEGGASPASGPVPGAVAAGEFLNRYVDEDGRVVRRDQGGDTVSEGQAYAMLAAVGTDAPDTFASVWSWTRENLTRDDGLLSYLWADGAVQDPSSASDADLDAARALVLAAERFDRPAYRRAGVELGEAILAHETVPTPQGLVLVAGQWATAGPPYAFNPSYVSPVATRLLEEASGDARWADLEAGSRAALRAATPEANLPPDWAQVEDDGSATPTDGPAGQPVQFGYDAARTLVRHAESCDRVDERYAARTGRVLGTDPARAIYDLGGGPLTSDASPLSSVAQAAGAVADGREGEARASIREAREASDRTPTYYGDAWAALGPMMLGSDVLGGCPPLETS